MTDHPYLPIFAACWIYGAAFMSARNLTPPWPEQWRVFRWHCIPHLVIFTALVFCAGVTTEHEVLGEFSPRSPARTFLYYLMAFFLGWAFCLGRAWAWFWKDP